jgi:NTP pyrophosphatase (non-canonical NTP hydrolase)
MKPSPNEAVRKELIEFLLATKATVERGPGAEYDARVLLLTVEDRCSAGAEYPHAEEWTFDVTEIDELIGLLSATAPLPANARAVADLTFSEFRRANVERCIKWHPAGIASWSPSDWLTAVTGELGELASLLKMRNRERDGLAGNKFSPTDKMLADEIADVLTYLDLLAEVLGVDLGRAAVSKFNDVSERVGFPDRLAATLPEAPQPSAREVANEAVRLAGGCIQCGPAIRAYRDTLRGKP